MDDFFNTKKNGGANDRDGKKDNEFSTIETTYILYNRYENNTKARQNLLYVVLIVHYIFVMFIEIIYERNVIRVFIVLSCE